MSAERNETAFTIQERGDLSLQGVIDLQQRGEPVLRTLHVGNIALYNAALLDGGVRVAAYDRTVPRRDTNYHPGSYIADGETTTLIDDEAQDYLTANIRSKSVTNLPKTHGRPLLSTLHTAGMQDIFPQADIKTMSEYFLAGQHEQYLHTTINTLVPEGYGEWSRSVTSNGEIFDVSLNPVDAVERFGVFKDGSETRDDNGMLLPNSYVILLTAINDALTFSTDTVYHLSGPDMIRYIHRMAPDLDAMYQTMVAKSSLPLPKQLTFNVVPTAAAQFVSTADRTEELDYVLQAYADYTIEVAKRGERKRVIAHGPQDKADIKLQLRVESDKTNQARGEIGRILHGFPELFSGTKDGEYATQYDVRTKGLYVPESTRYSSFDELTATLKAMKKLLKTTKQRV